MGYRYNQMRDKHELTHRGGFGCTYNACDVSILGFTTNQELAKHMMEHDPPPSTIVFPRVHRCSLRRALESAIDQDDAVAVSAFCEECPDSLVAKDGLLKRAVNKKSRKAAKVLLQVFPIKSKHKLHQSLCQNGNASSRRVRG